MHSIEGFFFCKIYRMLDGDFDELRLSRDEISCFARGGVRNLTRAFEKRISYAKRNYYGKNKLEQKGTSMKVNQCEHVSEISKHIPEKGIEGNWRLQLHNTSSSSRSRKESTSANPMYYELLLQSSRTALMSKYYLSWDYFSTGFASLASLCLDTIVDILRQIETESELNSHVKEEIDTQFIEALEFILETSPPGLVKEFLAKSHAYTTDAILNQCVPKIVDTLLLGRKIKTRGLIEFLTSQCSSSTISVPISDSISDSYNNYHNDNDKFDTNDNNNHDKSNWEDTTVPYIFSPIKEIVFINNENIIFSKVLKVIHEYCPRLEIFRMHGCTTRMCSTIDLVKPLLNIHSLRVLHISFNPDFREYFSTTETQSTIQISSHDEVSVESDDHNNILNFSSSFISFVAAVVEHRQVYLREKEKEKEKDKVDKLSSSSHISMIWHAVPYTVERELENIELNCPIEVNVNNERDGNGIDTQQTRFPSFVLIIDEGTSFNKWRPEFRKEIIKTLKLWGKVAHSIDMAIVISGVRFV
jgi:hypothetical protein